MKPHFGYLIVSVCTKMWYGYLLNRWTLGFAPFPASCNMLKVLSPNFVNYPIIKYKRYCVQKLDFVFKTRQWVLERSLDRLERSSWLIIIPNCFFSLLCKENTGRVNRLIPSAVDLKLIFFCRILRGGQFIRKQAQRQYRGRFLK